MAARAALVVVLAISGILPLASGDGAEVEPVDEESVTLDLFCEDSPFMTERRPGYFPAMESTWVPLLPNGRGACASHFGHHHYFPGVDRIYTLVGGTGQIVEVEQNLLSPAMEVPRPTGDNDSVVLATTFTLQVSLDGITWEDVTTADHRVVSVDVSTDPEELALKNFCDNTGTCRYNPSTQTADCVGVFSGCTGNNLRQRVDFNIIGDGQTFRFVRVHNPVSIYTGLSGFLDHSRFLLQATTDGPEKPENLAPEIRSFGCQSGVFEDMHPSSPCTFGGYVQEETPVGLHGIRIGNVPGQWDSPSFFHTYPLGEGRLFNVSGNVTVRDWRTDGFGPGREVWFEASLDGIEWTRLHDFTVAPVTQDLLTRETEAGLFAGSFNVTVDGTHARLVRLVTEPLLPDYWGPGTDWPERHPWAYFKDSSLTIEGLLP